MLIRVAMDMRYLKSTEGETERGRRPRKELRRMSCGRTDIDVEDWLSDNVHKVRKSQLNVSS